MIALPDKTTLVMGVLNVTPDSFSDGGAFVDVEIAVEHAKAMVAAGANIIDIGGESSRPGSEPVSEEDELARVLPVLARVVEAVDVPVSIDTYKPSVAEVCLGAGAAMVNDISGLRGVGDDASAVGEPSVMAETVARHGGASVCVMHMQGTPKSMQAEPHYTDVVAEVRDFLVTQAGVAQAAGVTQVFIDPGIGFGKTLAHNLTLLKHTNVFMETGLPVLVGASRKSFIEMVTGAVVADRLPGTIAAHTASILGGARIVRVHDVAEAAQAAQIADAIRNAH